MTPPISGEREPAVRARPSIMSWPRLLKHKPLLARFNGTALSSLDHLTGSGPRIVDSGSPRREVCFSSTTHCALVYSVPAHFRAQSCLSFHLMPHTWYIQGNPQCRCSCTFSKVGFSASDASAFFPLEFGLPSAAGRPTNAWSRPLHFPVNLEQQCCCLLGLARLHYVEFQ